MKPNRRQTITALAAAATAPSLAIGLTSTAAHASSQISPDEARAIAKEVFLWGMHPIAIYHMRYNYVQNEKSPYYAGLGRLRWERAAKTADRFATTPNATALYGIGFYDLSREPVVVTAGDIKDRYWSVQVVDNYSRWWLLVGNQFNAPGQVRRLLIGPNWNAKFPPDFAGAEIAQSPSNTACVAARVALTDGTADELRAANAVQDHITVMSLSQWIAAGRKDIKAEDVPLTKGSYPAYPGMERVREPGQLKGVDFLRWVSLILNDPSFTKQTDGHKEIEAFARFERLGLKAGETLDPEKLSPAIKAAAAQGIEDGRNAVIARINQITGIDMNGWSLTTDLGYNDTDWVDRARYGYMAIFTPVPSCSHTGAFLNKDFEGPSALGRVSLHPHL